MFQSFAAVFGREIEYVWKGFQMIYEMIIWKDTGKWISEDQFYKEQENIMHQW